MKPFMFIFSDFIASPRGYAGSEYGNKYRYPLYKYKQIINYQERNSMKIATPTITDFDKEDIAPWAGNRLIDLHMATLPSKPITRFF